MSKIEEVLAGLTDTMREVMAADSVGEAAHTAHPSTRAGLVDRGLIEMRKRAQENGDEAVLTDLGSDVRNALLSAGKQGETGASSAAAANEDLNDSDQSQPLASLFALRLYFPADVPVVNLRGLTADDVVLDDTLAEACFEDLDGILWCVAIVNERVAAETACLAAYEAARQILDATDQDDSLIADLSQERMGELFRAQWAEKQALPVETCFRYVVPQAGERWESCPGWLKAYFSVFAATAVALRPIVNEHRDDLVLRVEAIKRMQGEERAKKKAAARLKANQDKLKARIRARQKAPPIKKD